MTPKARRVSIAEFAFLAGMVLIDIGLLLYTAFRVTSHRGSEAGRPLFWLLPSLIIGGLFALRGIHSLNTMLPLSQPVNDGIPVESLSVSTTYTATMLVYGCLLLLITVAGGLVVVDLNVAL